MQSNKQSKVSGQTQNIQCNNEKSNIIMNNNIYIKFIDIQYIQYIIYISRADIFFGSIKTCLNIHIYLFYYTHI